MKCEDALEKISAMIDGELEPGEQAEVQAHLEGCARCRAVYEAYLGIDDALAKDAQEPPAVLRESVMDAIRADKKKKSARHFKGAIAAALAVAAVFIVLCGAGVIDLPGISEDGQASVSVGQTLHERFERNRQKKQAQALAEENGCAVLALWTKQTPDALENDTFTQLDGARVYEADASVAHELVTIYGEDSTWFGFEQLEENGGKVIVVVFS